MLSTSSPEAVSCLLPTSHDFDLLKEALCDSRERLGGDPDLAVCFVSSDIRSSVDRLIEHLQIDGHASKIVGASASGMFGVGREMENQSGISFLFLRLPESSISVSSDPLSDSRSLDGNAGASIVLAHPFRSDPHTLAGALERRLDGPIIGGQISGGPEIDDLFLFTENGVCDTPTVSITFQGGVRIAPLVSQACRPIGEPLIVTGAKGTSITSIASQKPLQVLEEAFTDLALLDRETSRGNIFAGVAIGEERDEFTAGDFLIRPILSADLERGELELSAPARVGQTVQFQLRSATVATETLAGECCRLYGEHGKPFTSLLFAGRERGISLFNEENHDITIFQDNFGQIPISGMFGSGEFGPVDGHAFHHDHSLCGALFYAIEGSI